MQIKGSFDGTALRVGVVVARFNDLVTSRLAEGCREALERHGVGSVDWAEVPGSRELPVAARAMAMSGRYDAVVALGCVIRGETVHFDLVAQEASRGLGQVATDSGVPVLFGVLATETLEQALQRAGGKVGNAGWDAAVAAIETATLVSRVEKGEA
ncbi:MAG TPA: 6,7-dimethyl-8-ribityllumazine synthase [Actinomycetota bacterium]|nr:6,7-dimethyl-8-ribityllumazine synthase [Actinomycetota bacterium]